MKSSTRHDVFLEIGKKKVFAGSVEWPGWCRFGRDEGSALQVMLDSSPRYAQVLEPARLGFNAPQEISNFNVVERVEGNATTDFGGVDAVLTSDTKPIDDQEMERFQAVLKSCWKAFDEAVSKAKGKELRKGPRGGGRDLERIVDHVLMADEGYLKRISWKFKKIEGEGQIEQINRIRVDLLEGLVAAAKGELPTVGPRGGKRWTPRFFIRRVAWHVLDHAWEIEDRTLNRDGDTYG